MKILVLGSGPAGLLAAHAASYVEGAEVKILSKGRPSELFGCQYLHAPIPGLDLRTTTVHYLLNGTTQDYARKVYGSAVTAPTVSPALLNGPAPAWDIRQAYHQLCELYFGQVEEMEVQPETVRPLLDYLVPDLVVSSIPLMALCQRPGECNFSSQTCWAMGDAPARGQSVPVPCPENTVVCNGTPDTSWYRVSNVFGHKTVEWPGLRPKPPLEGVVPFHKPLATTCDCWQPPEGERRQPEHIFRVGRYGTWTKGVLSHTAFNWTAEVLREGIISR